MDITSKENFKIKKILKLNQKKYRQEFGEFKIENPTIIFDALKSGIIPKELYLAPEILKEENIEKLKNINSSLVFESVSPAINKYFTCLENPSGICAVYAIPEYSTLNLKQAQRLIYLHKINDPGNLGTILRSALAFGFKEIILDENCVNLYNPKTVHASRETIFKFNFYLDEKQKILTELKNKMPILVADLNGLNNFSSLKKESFCLVLSNETIGPNEEIKSLADEIITIPISDQVESLNVASAGAILFYLAYKNDT